MPLSPPKASRAGLRALQAAKRDTTASTVIHAIVTVCTRWIRRIASGGTICSTEAIHSIMAPYSHGSRSRPLDLTLGVSFMQQKCRDLIRHSVGNQWLSSRREC